MANRLADGHRYIKNRRAKVGIVSSRILVVEDEKDIVRLLKYNLEKEGYSVLAAHDGQAGLDMARKENPDLILLDLTLPNVDGMHACRTLRQESQVPIIMVTDKKDALDRV